MSFSHPTIGWRLDKLAVCWSGKEEEWSVMKDTAPLDYLFLKALWVCGGGHHNQHENDSNILLTNALGDQGREYFNVELLAYWNFMAKRDFNWVSNGEQGFRVRE